LDQQFDDFDFIFKELKPAVLTLQYIKKSTSRDSENFQITAQQWFTLPRKLLNFFSS